MSKLSFKIGKLISSIDAMQRDKRSRAHHRIDLTLNTVAYQMKTIREIQFLK